MRYRGIIVMKIGFTLRLSLLAAAQIAGLLIVRAQSTSGIAAKVYAPRIEFSETVFDFGKVKSSDVLRHDFIVKNTGATTLEVTKVTPDCGCTTAGDWDRRILPGQTGRVPVEMRVDNFDGVVTKSIAVSCNDPDRPNHTLRIRATIWRPIDVQPRAVYFGPIEGEESRETKRVLITCEVEQPVTMDAPVSSNPDFKVDLKTVQPGKVFELFLTYEGPVVEARAESSITIKNSSAELPLITLPAYVLPQPAIVLNPLRIRVPAARLSAGFQHAQAIFNRSSTPLRLSEASVNAEGVAVRITEPQPGKQFQVTVSFPPGFHWQSSERLQLMVKTSHRKHPVLIIPIEITSSNSTASPRAPGRSK